MNKKLADLTDEEFAQVTGGDVSPDTDTQHKYKLSVDPGGKWLSE